MKAGLRPRVRKGSNLWRGATSRPYSSRRFTKTSVLKYYSTSENQSFWNKLNLTLIAANLTSHVWKRNSEAESVGRLTLAAESSLWRQYTWFGAEKCNYTARALARRCKRQINWTQIADGRPDGTSDHANRTEMKWFQCRSISLV